MAGFSLQMMFKLKRSGDRVGWGCGCVGMLGSQEAQEQGRERLRFQSLLLIGGTGPPPGLPLGRLNETRDGHYSL